MTDWKKITKIMQQSINNLERERDIWEKTANDYLPRIERLEDALEKAERERDEALADLKKENIRLRKAIEDAPHHLWCSVKDDAPELCDCWKQEVLGDE